MYTISNTPTVFVSLKPFSIWIYNLLEQDEIKVIIIIIIILQLDLNAE
jgi:hypothetical protein